MDDALPDPLALWFTDRGWTPRRHQLDMLAAAQAGQHALLVAPTGAGKTLAGFFPVLADLIASGADGHPPLSIFPPQALGGDFSTNSPPSHASLKIELTC